MRAQVEKVVGRIVFIVLVGPVIAVIWLLFWPLPVATWSGKFWGFDEAENDWNWVPLVAGFLLTALWLYCLYRFGLPCWTQFWVRLSDQ
jgi:hypothetical protein